MAGDDFDEALVHYEQKHNLLIREPQEIKINIGAAYRRPGSDHRSRGRNLLPVSEDD